MGEYIRLKHSLPCVGIATGRISSRIYAGYRQYIPVHLIRNTQSFISVYGFNYYMKRPSYTDSYDNVIWGYRFLDSPNVYLMNGHHRTTAFRCLGKQKLYIEIVEPHINLADILHLSGYCEQTIKRALGVLSPEEIKIPL